MIRVSFRCDEHGLYGYRVTGHAGAGMAGEDIVCAAVSSAAYMTANTITDILGATAAITVDDGLMDLTVTHKRELCHSMLAGFRLHIEALQQQYPQRVHIINSEV